MTTPNHQSDAALDKLLAALNSAQPPEGMESRIAARLTQSQAQQPEPAISWRDRILGYTLSSAWWRGAAAGAAIAALAIAAVFLALRPTPHTQIAVHNSTPAPTPVSALTTAVPCPQPAILRTHALATPPLQIASTSSSSHPVGSSPLTSQERALIRFAQTADPKTIASLSSERQAQLEAENDAQFNKFFTHPPPPPQPKIDPPIDANPDTSAQPAEAPTSSESAPSASQPTASTTTN